MAPRAAESSRSGRPPPHCPGRSCRAAPPAGCAGSRGLQTPSRAGRRAARRPCRRPAAVLQQMAPWLDQQTSRHCCLLISGAPTARFRPCSGHTMLCSRWLPSRKPPQFVGWWLHSSYWAFTPIFHLFVEVSRNICNCTV